MSVISLSRSNLAIVCDSPGCQHQLNGIVPSEVRSLRRGCNGDGMSDPFWQATPVSVRRQARRKGWSTVVDGRGEDACPSHFVLSVST